MWSKPDIYHENLNCLMTKPTKWLWAQQRLCVWSGSLLSAQLVAKDPSFLHVDSEDWSDWADAQADPSLHWAHMPFCWFCHEAAHLSKVCFSRQNTILYWSQLFQQTSLCKQQRTRSESDQGLHSLQLLSTRSMVITVIFSSDLSFRTYKIMN